MEMLKQLKQQINLTAFKHLTKLLWTSFCLSTGKEQVQYTQESI